MAYPLGKGDCESLGAALNSFVVDTERGVEVRQVGRQYADHLAALIYEVDRIYDGLCEYKWPGARGYDDWDTVAAHIERVARRAD
jgi:hypothetical protein